MESIESGFGDFISRVRGIRDEESGGRNRRSVCPVESEERGVERERRERVRKNAEVEKKGETAGKGDDEEDGMISTFVQGLEVLLFKGIFTKQSFALDELSSDLVDVARGVFWPTVSKTCIQTWNLGSKQALLTDDDVDSVVALERRVASLGLLNSYGLGSALDTVAGPLEIAAMQGEIESRLDFRVNSLASARDAGKTPAISDELLQTKAKEEEVKGHRRMVRRRRTTAKSFSNCTALNSRRREQSRVLRCNF